MVDVDENEDGTHMWSSVLSDVTRHSIANIPVRHNVLVLGDRDCGKTTTFARFQGREDPKVGVGLEYQFVDVKDESRDENCRLSVWLLDGDPYHSGLIKFALNEDTFAHSLVVLMVSLAEPWTMMDSLNQWVDILEKHVGRLKISRDTMDEYKESLTRQFQSYVEPQDETPITEGTADSGTASGTTTTTSKPAPSKSARRQAGNPLHPPASQDPDNVLLPLAEGAFTNNLGIPIVVVVTKTDTIPTLERELDYKDEHFDFIQKHIRIFSLTYGAALFYTSLKEDKNVDLLNRYLQHRIYGFPFTCQAYVVDRDTVFVPSGWDNLNKISILEESMSPEVKFSSTFSGVIARPPSARSGGVGPASATGSRPAGGSQLIARESEVLAEDEQVFLLRLQSLIQRGGTGSSAADVGPPGSGKDSRGVSGGSRNPGGQTGGKGKPGSSGAPGAPPGANNEGVLANFFNSLLNKRTVGEGGPEPGPGDQPTSSPVGDTPRSNASQNDTVDSNQQVPAAEKNNNVAEQRTEVDSLVKPTDEPIKEPVAEPITKSKPVAEPIAESEPVTEPITESEPGAESITKSEPGAESITKSEPGAEPITKSEPVAEPIAESEPVTEPITESEPVAESITESEQVDEPITNSEPVAEPITESEQVDEPIIKSEPLSEPITNSNDAEYEATNSISSGAANGLMMNNEQEENGKMEASETTQEASPNSMEPPASSPEVTVE